MKSRRHLRGQLFVAAIVALGVSFAASHAAAQKASPVLELVPAKSAPPVPRGLKVTCLRDPNQLQSSNSCPVVKYQGITTWAYSYIDNRLSMALVSYDRNNYVVRDVEKPGARYVFDALSSVRAGTVIFVGQANRRISVRWTQLGAK